MDPISVVIVDDHTMARAGLRAMIETDLDVTVVGEAEDGLQALELVAQLAPKVVLMDVRMPRMDGLEATRRIKAEHPATSVIIVTSFEDDPLVIEAVLQGAAGFLMKDTSRDLLTYALKAVSGGGVLVKGTLLRKALNTLAHTEQPPNHGFYENGEIDHVTQREIEVLTLAADGRTNKEIAEALCLAEVTVKKHIQTIIAKLHVSDRTQAATVGMRLGLIK